MRLKSLIVFFFLFVFLQFGCTSKQDHGVEIRELLSRYSEFSIKENYEGMLTLMHPAAIEKYSQKEIINSLRNGYHNEDYDMHINKVVIDSISDIRKEGSSKYVFVKSHAFANFTLTPYLLTNTLKLREAFNSHCKGFKDIFGEANVNCVYTERKYEVISHESFFAIYTTAYKKWLPFKHQRSKRY